MDFLDYEEETQIDESDSPHQSVSKLLDDKELLSEVRATPSGGRASAMGVVISNVCFSVLCSLAASLEPKWPPLPDLAEIFSKLSKSLSAQIRAKRKARRKN